MNISIVIISKNEESVIEKGIRAAVIACRTIYSDGQYEIVIVDSNSSDQSIVLAENVFDDLKVKNWRIIQYKADRYTAALGRQVGIENSRGNFLLFLDADMCIYSSFIKYADDYFRTATEDIVGIVGERIDAIYKNNRISRVARIERKHNQRKETLYPGGCGYYSRIRLKSVGFNILQKTREEEAFAKQLFSSGKRIMYVRENMYLHLNYKLSRRNVFERLQLVKQSSKDYIYAIRAHADKFGFIDSIISYNGFILSNIVVPILILLSLILFKSNLYCFLLTLIITFIYLIKQKLQIFTMFFLVIFLFSRSAAGNNFSITKDKTRKKEEVYKKS
jgi:glycosyltransferase involved in cell wall biosynthesis